MRGGERGELIRAALVAEFGRSMRSDLDGGGGDRWPCPSCLGGMEDEMYRPCVVLDDGGVFCESRNDCTPEMILAELRLDDDRRAPSGKGRTTMTMIQSIVAASVNIGAIQCEVEPDWIWDGMVAPGCTTLLAAKPKVGKSTLLFGLLRGLAAGEAVAGLRTRPARVLYLSEEGGQTTKARAERFSLQTSTHVRFISKRTVPGARWADWVGAAVEMHGDDPFDLVVFDTYNALAGMKGDDEKNAGPHLEAVGQLDALLKLDVAVLLVCHTRKAEGEDITDLVRGGNALTGAVDIVAVLDRAGSKQPRTRRLRAVSRFDATPETWTMELGQDNLYRSTEPLTSEEARSLDDFAQLPPPSSPPFTAKEAAPHLGVKEDRAKRRLDAWAANGMLVKAGKGTKSDPTRYSHPSSSSSSDVRAADQDGNRRARELVAA